MGKLHSDFINIGINWFVKNGFPVVSKELNFYGSSERPDIIAFRSNCSAIAEVKVSRSDFLKDSLKSSRKADSSLGIYRFYLSSPDIISVSDLPDGWGLLHVYGSSIVQIAGPSGNLWPPMGSGPDNWRCWQNSTDFSLERDALFSISRRLVKNNKMI